MLSNSFKHGLWLAGGFASQSDAMFESYLLTSIDFNIPIS